ncbi:MAG: hypothetical protein ACRCZP_15125 [Phycicoccus sp.]
MRRWAAPEVPLARLAVFRTAVYLFVLFDIAQVSDVAFSHGDTPASLYRPLVLRSALNLPAPNPVYVRVLVAVIVISALVAAAGRLPRLAGWTCCAAMLDWLSNAFSYGKVDHDHLALVVALAVLPTAGPARWRDDGASEAAGWALRCVQVGAVATYALSAVAKVRFGGWGWPSSAVFTWAFVRRGTGLAEAMLRTPWLVVASQWALITAEALSPALLFLRRRLLYLALAGFASFHLATWLLLRIHFLPLVVCLLAFLPLERLVPARWRGTATGGTARPGRAPTEAATGRPKDDAAVVHGIG